MERMQIDVLIWKKWTQHSRKGWILTITCIAWFWESGLISKMDFYGTAKLPIPPLLTSFPTKTHYTKPSKQQSTSPPTCFSPSHSVPSLPDLIIQTAVLPDHLVHTPPLSSSKVTQAHFSLARNIWAEGTQIILAATRGKRFQSMLVKMWQPMEF